MNEKRIREDIGTRLGRFTIRGWISRLYRSLLARPFAFVLLMCVIGGYSGFFLSNPFRMAALVFPIAFLALLISIRPKCRELVVFCLSIVVFLWSFIFFSCKNDELIHDFEPYSFEGEAKVVSLNVFDNGYKNIVLKLDNGMKAILLTEDTYEYGAVYQVKGRLSKVVSKGNPGDTDIVGYYRRLGISLKFDNHTRLNKVKDGPVFIRYGFALRQQVKDVFYDYWMNNGDEKSATILASMILGDDSYMASEDKNAFKESALSHLLVVSGAHVAYFTSTISVFYALVSNNRMKKNIFLTLSLILFGFLTGWGSSATRSILTFITISWLSLEHRSSDRLSACCLSAIILELIDPYAIFSYGVLLSFGSTLSIMMFHFRMSKRIIDMAPELPYELCQAISCFLCSQLGMMPVLILIGHSLSPIKLLIVVLAGFPSELICSFGLVSTLFGLIIPFSPVDKLLMLPLRGLVDVLITMAKLGSLSIFHGISFHNLSPYLVLAVCCGLLVMALKSGFKRKLVVVLMLEAIAFSMFVPAILHLPVAKVYFLDVGQGDAALIVMDGKTVLIDGGKPGCGRKNIEKTMNYLDISKIDMAIISHLDSDHIAGILELWEDGKVERLFAPFWSQSAEMVELRSVCDSLPEDVEILKYGDSIILDSNSTIRVIWPISPKDGGNEDSLVLLAYISGTEILFTGDIGFESENCIQSMLPEEIDILKVAHHGSKYSTSFDLVSSKKIDAAVISVGYNFYGHPSEETIKRLEDNDIAYFRTDQGGCIEVDIYKNAWEIDYYFN